MLVWQGRNATPAVFNAASIQARSYAEAKAAPTEVSSILEQRIRGVQEEAGLAETGRVLSVGYVTSRRKRPDKWDLESHPEHLDEISSNTNADFFIVMVLRVSTA